MEFWEPENSVESEGLHRFCRNFERVREFVARRVPHVRDVILILCAQIDNERNRCRRAYMHTGHHVTGFKRETICAAKASMDLDDDYQCGILFHEFGHVITPGGTEQDADRAIFEMFGIPLVYKGDLDLEWVDSTKIFGK